MGCFSACFFGRCSNRYKKIRSRHGVLDQKIQPTREAQIAEHLKTVEERRDKKEGQLNRSSRKSIDFDDLNLTNQVTGEKEKGSVIVLPEVLYSDEKAVGEQGIKNQQKFQKENPEKETEGDEEKKKLGKEMILEETGRDEIIPLPDSSESSLFTYPKSNRYKNCAENSDDEEDEVVVSSYKVVKEEESSESSLFSLSIDSRRSQSFTPGGRTVGEDKEEVSSKTFITPIPSDDKDKHMDSVLKPIENLNQWEKIVGRKAKSSSTMEKKQKQEQENVESEEFMFPLQLKKKTSNSCRVDISLSSWLVESENSPEVSVGNLSSSSLKKTKSSSSIGRRRRSYSFSPNETPILGTVGSYWRHTDAADSGSSMSGRNQTNSFQTRLEEAMDSVKS